MAMDRARASAVPRSTKRSSAPQGVVGLQSKDGGWARSTPERYHYLNNIPFADHGALLDPPTADDRRCLSMLAQLGERPRHRPMRRALRWLERDHYPTEAGTVAGA